MDNKEFPEYIKELCQKKKIPGIVIFIEDYENIRDELNDQQKGLLLDSLIEYGKEKNKPTLGDPLVRMAFNMCKGAIDRSAKSYEKRCQKNRENVIKRWEKERERQAQMRELMDRHDDGITDCERTTRDDGADRDGGV